jgi:hypothetical protein
MKCWLMSLFCPIVLLVYDLSIVVVLVYDLSIGIRAGSGLNPSWESREDVRVDSAIVVGLECE